MWLCSVHFHFRMSDSDEYQKQLDRLSKLEADVNGTGDDDSTIISNESLKIIKAEPETQELENVSQEQPVTIQDAAPIPSDTKTPPQIEEENGSMKSASQQEMENEDKNQVEKGVERDDSNQQEIDEKAIDIQDSMKDEKPSKNNKIDEKSDEMVSKKPASDKDDSSASHNSDSDDSLPEYKKRNGYLSKRVTRNATGSLPKETKTLLMETTEVFDPSKSKKRPTARPGHVNVLAPECTSCGSDVILRPFQRRMLIHPYLKTAVCRQCHEFYHSDTFGVDDEGSQIYCIWCGEGGELIYCDKCEKAFCTDCIKRNFGKKVREKILAQSNWECLVCKPEMTSDLRKVAQMIVKYQNLCIKDQYLIEKFECEVTKADLKKEDYQGIVSTRIKQRNSATLLSSSQQKEESQRGSAESGQSNNEDSEGKEDEEGEDSSENSSGDEYDASKDTENKPIKKKRSKEKVNGKNKESDSEDSSDIDDEEFLKCIRKKAVDRHESNTTTSAKKTDQKVASKETSKPETNGDSSSDDSLFDTGNPSVKAKNIRKCFDSTDGEDEDISDENDELVQKYRNKLSKFKETSDKESEHSNYSEESSATSSDDEEDDKEKSESSDSSKDEQSVSETEVKDSANGDEGKDKTSKNEKKSKTSRKRKKKGGSEKESDEEEEGKKTKRKRKRKKKKSSESDSDEEEEDADKKKKSKKGKRKKIRKILGQNQLQKETVAAQEAEDERRRKLKEKSLPSQQGKILNFILEDLRKEKYRSQPPTIDDEERGKVIEVHKHLKKRLKPHQLDGIQFMYDCCIESVEKVKSGSEGSGAILAHCMGLGKTFQVITFLTTVLNYHYIFGFKRALVVCPLNTILNWKAEFDKWLKDMDDAPEVSVLTDNIHSNDKRLEIVENWFETSGVLIVGYSLFRLLSTGSNIRKKNLKESFKKYLVEPGPDIVICDEGHVIKNEKTGISKALNSLKTKRRVILTGTPLQNNLVEYHCMVSFVKPNLLGTTKEFKNMYENPINNGQCVDATDFDIRLMKERSHILYEQLSGCVQRRDYTVLREFLPQKYEYVLSIKLSDLQVKLYQKYLEKAKATGGMMSKLFECYQTLKKVWTHPWLLEIDALKNEKDSIEDFITDREDTSEDSWEASSEDSDFGPQKKKRKKNSKKKGEKEEKEKEKETEEAKPEDKEPGATNNPDATMVQAIADTIVPVGGSIDYNWFKGEMTEKDEKMLEHSGKLLVTLEILDKASQKGDKVLLFSQSLLALDFLETSITRVGWTKGRDYFRMDGSTKTHHRSSFQKQFNDKSNKRCRLFLISTKAGGLGQYPAFIIRKHF